MEHEQEMVRITESRYEEIKSICEYIDEQSSSTKQNRETPLFADKDNFPPVAELEDKELGIVEHFREWIPWFVYYREVYRPRVGEQERFKETWKWIDDYLTQWLDVIPDEDVAKIRTLNKKEWGKMTLPARCKCFQNLVAYYSPDDHSFNGFIKDLGWQNFMLFYDIQDKTTYAENERLRNDLRQVFDRIQSAPLQL